MISIPQIALLLATAALLVAAGPTPGTSDAAEAPTAVADQPFVVANPADIGSEGRSINPDAYIDVRSITDASDPRLQRRNGQLWCGMFASADFGNAHQLVGNLRTNPNRVNSIAAHGCKRVQCMNTSGIYVCNDRNSAMTLTNGDVYAHTYTILNQCCIHNIFGTYDNQRQAGGQQFTDALGGGWNG